MIRVGDGRKNITGVGGKGRWYKNEINKRRSARRREVSRLGNNLIKRK